MDIKKARESHRREVCRQFRENGLTRKAFCETNDIGLSTLGFWLQEGPRVVLQLWQSVAFC